MPRRPLDPNGKVIRIVARPPARLSPRRVNTLVAGALAATTWGKKAAHRTTLFDPEATGVSGDDLLIEVAVPDTIGSPRYAKRANDLVQRLYDTDCFLRVEADIPVAAFDPAPPAAAPGRGRTAPRSAAAGDCAGDPLAAPPDWALDEMNVPAALALLPPAAAKGKGVRIGHPDSGYATHFALGLAALDRTRDRDVISGDDEARDPLRPPKATFFNPLPNPGHGTSTASVIVGVGDGSGFAGVATGASLVPIRATESVVQVFDSDVAKAVRWARQVGCHVVSMSLGGKGFFGLDDAIDEAVEAGMIVMAAAGNQVGFVTAPASYAGCLAVAATRADGTPWPGSSRGAAVDVSAPGSCVWAAHFDWSTDPPTREVTQSHGTSYAVAHVAGVAALWIAKHGHANLVARFGRPNVQAAFLQLLRRPGVCRRPPGWDGARYGAGIIDAFALLDAALPQPFAVSGPRARAGGADDDPIARLAAQTDTPRRQVAVWIDALLGPGASTDDALLRRFEGELAYLALTDPTLRTGLTARRRTLAAPPALPAASPQLAARLTGPRAIAVPPPAPG